MTFPTIHPNGTNAKDLIADLLIAYTAVGDAIDALKRCAPNGRDYYPQGPVAMEAASKEHWERMGKMNEVRDELEELARGIQKAGAA